MKVLIVIIFLLNLMQQQKDAEQLQSINDKLIEIVHNVSFNWDNSCIILATNKGFRIIGTQPIRLKQYRDLAAPLQFVEMFDRTNLLAFVGFQNSSFVAHKVAIFDDNSNSIVADLSFQSNILAIKIRMKKLVVALSKKVYVLDFPSLKLEQIIPTFTFEEDEPYGMISMSNDPENTILACPALQVGTLVLVLMNSDKQKRIPAHQSLLSAICITLDGDKVATASEKGQNIRIFSVETGEMIQEVRRGNEYAMIYSMSFSRAGNWLSCSSDSNTIHVFYCQPSHEELQKRYQAVAETKYSNPKSMLYCFRHYLGYFDAEYSYCRYQMGDFQSQMKTVVAFGYHDNALLVVNDYGTFRRVSLNLNGGKCSQILEVNELLQLSK